VTVIATTPEPPYYVVVFSSLRTEGDRGYGAMAERMMELAAKQEGFLGVESARGQDGLGLTVSYWRDLAAISAWKQNGEHLQAQRGGRSSWYTGFHVRIARVERAYSF
jgi:heme-degrading monooxygenase HmoA